MDHKVCVVFLHFVHFGFVLMTSSAAREYHYVDLPMTWTEAQLYCRTHYTDLATFDSMDDINKLNKPNTIDPIVWIGLHDDPKSWQGTMGRDENSWRWSATGTFSSTGYHDNTIFNYLLAKETCVVIDSDGWGDVRCSDQNYFVCYTTNDLGHKQYVLVEQQMTWDEASSHCRTHHTHLAMIENEEENTQVSSVRLSHTVWIGLYREPWRWSDGSSSTFTNWRSGQPNNYNQQHCVRENSDHLWDDVPCSWKIPFLCYKAGPNVMKIKIKMTSSADLSDPVISAQILRQIEEMMGNKMPSTDFRLRWTVSPRKEKEEKKENELTCEVVNMITLFQNSLLELFQYTLSLFTSS